MPLLGMLAAGAAIGARNASNLNTQAQNELEIGDARERLRQQFSDRQYQQSRIDAKDDARNQALLNQAIYNRDRANKLADEETKHERALDIEGRKDSRNTATNAARLKAAMLRKEGAASGGGGKGDNGKGLILENGEVFNPSSPEYRFAVDMVKSGEFPNIKDAIRAVIARGLTSQAAQDQRSYSKGSVFVAKDMADTLFGNDLVPQQGNAVRTFNPATGKFE